MKVYRFLFLFLCFIVFIACNPLVEEENNDPPSPGDNDSSSLIDQHENLLYTGSAVIGASGGTVDIMGTEVLEIPAGALEEDVEIRVGLTVSPDSSQEILGNSSVRELLICEPEGLVFLSPVTVSLPSMYLDYTYETHEVLLHDPESESWEWIGDTTEEGVALFRHQFTIDHFSSYGVSHMGAGKLSGIAESAESVSLAALAEDYVQDNGLLNLRRMKGGKLYQVCGVQMDLQTHIDGTEEQYVHLFGERGDIIDNISYMHDRLTTGGGQHIVNILVTLYWEEAEEEKWELTFLFEVRNAHFELGVEGDLSVIDLESYDARGTMTFTIPYDEWGKIIYWQNWETDPILDPSLYLIYSPYEFSAAASSESRNFGCGLFYLTLPVNEEISQSDSTVVFALDQGDMTITLKPVN